MMATGNGYTVTVRETEAHGWCVQWRSRSMAAPSFWYFEAEIDAKAAAWDLIERGAP